MTIKATNPADYISKLPAERQAPFQQLRQTILDNLPDGFEERMSSGMLGYVVPHERYPAGYHCDTKLPLPFINLGNQKNNLSLYHMGIYALPDVLAWFKTEYPKHSRRKLDMGKSCIRLKKMDDIPYALIAELIQKISVEDWIAAYEANIKR
ncbi:MAG: DUF1801 domain-containing protein [Bacteroidota bacterium]